MTGELDEFIDEWGFFVAIPELVIKAWPAIGTDAVAVFLYLRYRTNRERGIAFPSFDDMQSGMGWRRERIASALRGLEEHGFLKRRKKVGQVTAYWLVRPPDVAGIRSPDGGLRGDDASPDAEPSESAIRPSVVRQGDAIQDLVIQDSFTQERNDHRSSNDQTPWVQILTILKRSMDRCEFDTWVQPTEVLSLSGETLTLGCGNSIGMAKLENGHRAEIEAAAGEVLRRKVRVRFVVLSKVDA